MSIEIERKGTPTVDKDFSICAYEDGKLVGMYDFDSKDKTDIRIYTSSLWTSPILKSKKRKKILDELVANAHVQLRQIGLSHEGRTIYHEEWLDDEEFKKLGRYFTEYQRTKVRGFTVFTFNYSKTI